MPAKRLAARALGTCLLILLPASVLLSGEAGQTSPASSTSEGELHERSAPAVRVHGQVGWSNRDFRILEGLGSEVEAPVGDITAVGKGRAAGRTFASKFPPSSTGVVSYELMISDPHGPLPYDLQARVVLDEGRDEYLFAARSLASVAGSSRSGAAGLAVDLVECPGALNLQIVSPEGKPVAIGGAKASVFPRQRPGTWSPVSQASGFFKEGSSEDVLVVRSGVPLRLDLAWTVPLGVDDWGLLHLNGRCQEQIELACDEVRTVTCVVDLPDREENGRDLELPTELSSGQVITRSPSFFGPGDTIRVRQAGTEVEIEPIVGPSHIVPYYSYGIPFNATSNTGLERPDTSILFFYAQGSLAGPLSLVGIHDIYNDGDGGTVHWDISGLPAGVYYSVQDDAGGLGDFYSPDPPVGGFSAADWNWVACCTDGLALSGFEGEQFCVSIDPIYRFGINGWEVISGPSETRTPLPNLFDTTYLCCGCIEIECEETITAECESDHSAFVNVLASGSSLCGGASIVNDRTPNGPDASDTYDLGSTLVEFEETDAAGFQELCTTEIIVEDTTPPDADCPEERTVECTEPGGTPSSDPDVQDWRNEFLATDACGDATGDDDLPSFLPSGCDPGEPTLVTFTATDEVNLQRTCEATIRVVDSTAPEITACPTPMRLECEEPAGVPRSNGMVQMWLATFEAEDICNGAALANDAPDFFAWGCDPGEETAVEFRASDDCDNADTCESSLTVVDSTAPELTVPSPLVIECDDPDGVPLGDPRIQDWLSQAFGEDLCAATTVTHDAPSVFAPVCDPDDATVVTFRAEDECGNFTTQTSTVLVIDTTPPDLMVPAPLVLECDNPGGSPVTDPRIQAWLASATAEDVCGDATVGNEAPAFFPSSCPPGVPTPVLFFAEDSCGNRSEGFSSVTIVDTTPPEIEEIPFDGICLWPPNHKYYCLFDAADQVVATDVCDTDPPVIRLEDCASSQPDDGLGDGHTVNDCLIVNDGKGFCVRSERLGDDPAGRFYSVGVSAADACGNRSEQNAVIHVPHDMSEHPECLAPNMDRWLGAGPNNLM